MNLIIDNKEQIDLSAFCNYIINYLKENIIHMIDSNKLVKFDNYLNSTISDNRFIYNKKRYLSTKDILISSIYLLNASKLGNTYVIELDKTATIPNTYIRYIDIIKLINYGTLSINAYPIYDDIMNYLAENIDILYKNFWDSEG